MGTERMINEKSAKQMKSEAEIRKEELEWERMKQEQMHWERMQSAEMQRSGIQREELGREQKRRVVEMQRRNMQEPDDDPRGSAHTVGLENETDSDLSEAESWKADEQQDVVVELLAKSTVLPQFRPAAKEQ